MPSNEVALLNASLALGSRASATLGPKGQSLSMTSLLGLLLGFVGVALLVWPAECDLHRTSAGNCWCWPLPGLVGRHDHLPQHARCLSAPSRFNAMHHAARWPGAVRRGYRVRRTATLALGAWRGVLALMFLARVRLGNDLHGIHVADEERAHGSRRHVRVREPGHRDACWAGSCSARRSRRSRCWACSWCWAASCW